MSTAKSNKLNFELRPGRYALFYAKISSGSLSREEALKILKERNHKTKKINNK